MQSPEGEVGHQEKKVVVVSFYTTVAHQGREGKNLKLDESCISNSKLEISDWTDYRADWPVQFEMQDSSNFKFFLSLPS